MLFALHAIDKAGGAATRQEFYAPHRAHLERVADYGAMIVMSGPLVADDGAMPIGSLIIVEAPGRREAESFYHSDPFFKAGLWGKTAITAFKKVKG